MTDVWRQWAENLPDYEATHERLSVDKVGATTLLRAALRRLQLPDPDREFVLRCLLDAAVLELEEKDEP